MTVQIIQNWDLQGCCDFITCHYIFIIQPYGYIYVWVDYVCNPKTEVNLLAYNDTCQIYSIQLLCEFVSMNCSKIEFHDVE